MTQSYRRPALLMGFVSDKNYADVVNSAMKTSPERHRSTLVLTTRALRFNRNASRQTADDTATTSPRGAKWDVDGTMS